jgi:hypothetical protein
MRRAGVRGRGDAHAAVASTTVQRSNMRRAARRFSIRCSRLPDCGIGSQCGFDRERTPLADVHVDERTTLRCHGLANSARNRTVGAHQLRAAVVDVERIDAKSGHWVKRALAAPRWS